MGIISLVIPQIGQPDTTEDVKLQNALTTIQTVINGNIDTNNLNSAAAVKDAQLASPNNAARRLLATQTLWLDGGQTYSSGAWTWWPAGNPGVQPILTGASAGSVAPLVWSADPSLTIPGQTARGIVRVSTISNGVNPNVALTAGLTQVTGAAGSSGGISLTYSAPVLATAAITPGASAFSSVDSASFVLPTTTNLPFILVLALTGTSPVAANSFTGVTVSLLSFSS